MTNASQGTYKISIPRDNHAKRTSYRRCLRMRFRFNAARSCLDYVRIRLEFLRENDNAVLEKLQLSAVELRQFQGIE